VPSGRRPARGGSRGRSGARRNEPTVKRGAGRRYAERERERSGEPRERGRGGDLLARIAIAVPAAVVAILFIDLGGLPWALFMMVIAWLCLHELYRMLARWRPVAVVGFAAAAGMVLAARYGTERRVLEVAMAALPVVFLVAIARPRPPSSRPAAGVTVAIAGTLLGIYWLGFAFAHAVLLRELPHGNAIIIDVLIGTFLGDTGAYLGGRLFGRRPLAPALSPNKTVEGLFCGMLVAIVSVVLAGLYQTWLTSGDALLLGVAVAILAPVGDLFESALKRDNGVKDTGGAFGAHGGALDRLDAVSFTIVAGYYIWLAVMH
jgi:phosphatidate cytidylyltransferase